MGLQSTTHVRELEVRADDASASETLPLNIRKRGQVGWIGVVNAYNWGIGKEGKRNTIQ